MNIHTTKLACLLLVLFAIVSHGCAPAVGIFPAKGQEKWVHLAGVPHLDVDELDEVGFAVTAKEGTLETRVKDVSALADVHQAEGDREVSCLDRTSREPIATFSLRKAAPPSMVLKIFPKAGEMIGSRGFAIVSDNAAPLASCYQGREAWSAPKHGWPAGNYAVYPLTSIVDPSHGELTLRIWDPTNKVKWEGPSVKRIALQKDSLTHPLYVELGGLDTSRTLRARTHGCTGLYSKQPDVVLQLDRPFPGLRIRALYPDAEVPLRLAYHSGTALCGTVVKVPEVHEPTEVGIWLGSRQVKEVRNATLLVYDEKTAFDPLEHVHTVTSVSVPFEQRVIYNFFPGLGGLNSSDLKMLALKAELFALAPEQIFVYPKVNLEPSMVSGHGFLSDKLPMQDEPLLLLGTNERAVGVLTAEGTIFDIGRGWISDAPKGHKTVGNAPGKLVALTYEELLAMGPSHAKEVEERFAQVEQKRAACSDQLWKSYNPRIDAATRTIVNRGREIEVRSARANALYDEAERAVDRQCGPIPIHDPKVAAMRDAAMVTFRVDIEAERVRLFERATARFRAP